MTDAASDERLAETTSAEAEEQYRLLQPKYEKLATEVQYILQDALSEERIPVASVSRRVKSAASFAEKLRRKTYKNPLSDVTDLAGVRIVSYFRGDLARLERMIGQHFEVVEKVDKLAEKAVDKFGYTAVQFIVCVKASYLGARYDDLHGLKCEIQTRAVLEDAWAILDHHLKYKQESTIPAESARRINRLAAVIEEAESSFEEIRRDIEAHRDSMKTKSGDEFLDQPVNAITIAEFIERTVPGIQNSDRDEQAAFIWSLIDRTRFRTLADIDTAVRRTKKAVLALGKDTGIFAGQGVEYAIAFVDTSMRRRYADWFLALFRKHRHLVEDADEAG